MRRTQRLIKAEGKTEQQLERPEVVLGSKRQTQGEKFCSCLFLVTSRGGPGNPYAICRRNIYQNNPPPVLPKCVYTKEYLSSLTPQILMKYIIAKRIRIDEELKNSLIRSILEFFERVEQRRAKRSEKEEKSIKEVEQILTPRKTVRTTERQT